MISVGNSAWLDAATRAWCQCLGQAEQPWAPQQPLALARCGAVCILGALTPPLLHATAGISEARRATCPALGFPAVGYWVLFRLDVPSRFILLVNPSGSPLDVLLCVWYCPVSCRGAGRNFVVDYEKPFYTNCCICNPLRQGGRYFRGFLPPKGHGVHVCTACFSRDTFSVGGEAERQCA